jgi:hypothetical protein
MTQDEAIEAAGRVIAAGLALRDSLPPRQAAEICWTPSGPSVDELERQIRADRESAQTPVIRRAA